MEATILSGGTRRCYSCRNGVRCESSPLRDSYGRLFCTLSCAWSQTFREEAAAAAAATAIEAAAKRAEVAAAAEAAEAADEQAAAESDPIPSSAKPPCGLGELKARRHRPEFDGLWEMDMDEEDKSLAGLAETGALRAEAVKTP